MASEKASVTGIRVIHGAASDRRARSAVPESLTPLIGREHEFAEVAALLDDPGRRLVTLIGPGGVGKTRLALAVSRHAEDRFADGVILLRLAELPDPGMVVPALAQVLDRQLSGASEPVDQVAAALGGRQCLLVLDNFEHLVAEPPVWLVHLLARCPRVTALVTSRTALNISGEHRYVVSPLPSDAAGGELPAAAVLFAERARAVRPDFELDAVNREVVREICRRLDGLPLAIELAAARVTVMTPVEILGRMGDRFAILRGGRRDAPARQQTMRDAIAWSYDLLPTGQQRLFRQLAVLNGSFSLAAAAEVGGADEGDTLSGVEAMVDCSLLTAETSGTGTRFLMLETMREFGLEQLRGAGEEAAARDRMAAWCLALARQMSPNKLDASAWALIDRQEEEIGHLRATLSWLEEAGRMAEVAELVLRLRWLWFFQGREREGLQWLDRVMAWTTETRGTPDTDALIYAGHLAITSDDPRAEAWLTAAVTLAREAADRFREAEARFYLAGLLRTVGRFAEARTLFEEVLEVYRAIPVTWRVPIVTYQLGTLAYAEGDLDAAERLLEEAGRAADEDGNRILPAMSRAMLALVACERGDADRAVSLVEHRSGEVSRVDRADYEMLVDTAGVVAVACGQHELAARLFGAASQPGRERALPERRAFERAEAEARRRLGEEMFARAWTEGRRIPQAEIAIELARLSAPQGGSAASGRADAAVTAGLTPRELEVLRCLADGLSNRQIGDALFISRKTATNHVATILAKLGVESRTAAASLAIRHHLV